MDDFKKPTHYEGFGETKKKQLREKEYLYQKWKNRGLKREKGRRKRGEEKKKDSNIFSKSGKKEHQQKRSQRTNGKG